MTGDYAFTSQIWPSVFTTLLLIVLASYAWYHRSVPGAIPFAIGSLAGALWMAGCGMEIAAVSTIGKIFWVKFQAIWQLPGITAITFFILEYTWPGRWITRRVLAISSLPLLLFLALILTNNFHHWLWLDFISDGTITPIRAPVLWLFIIYGYLLFIINLSVLVWLYSHSPPHRWPVAILLASQVGIRSLYILNLANIQRFEIPIDVIGISILILGYAIVLFGFRILDPVTMAQQVLVEQMHDSMVVLDLQGRVETLNPSAERLFCIPNAEVKGKPVSELLPGLLDGHLIEDNESELSLEIIQQDGTREIRHYTLTNSLLKDFRGLEVGRLLLLHDVTTQKQAQQRILEQQRALAMLNERNQLARELHDSIGQVLGYVSMQAQAIRKRARDGDMPAVEVQLSRLVDTAQAAHADVRESILSLNTRSGEHWSFPTSLRQYLDAYHESYGIQTQLTLPDEFSNRWFEPEGEVQLLRVIQEAMNNARKHGQASCVQVSFVENEDGIRVLIADNGQGFDPELANEGEPGHYGVRFMRERAESLGGSLKIESSPGSGTTVVLQVKRGLTQRC